MIDINEFIEKDEFDRMLGIKAVEISKGYCKAEMEVTPSHLNGIGIAHGGALFTLADFAFAVAANTHEPVSVSVNVNMQYYKSVSSGKIIAEAREIHVNSKLGNYQVDIRTEAGEILATFHGMCFRKPNR